ncbi:hypothetical protein OKW34_001489 [Paraburkholderia youngii]
MARIRTSSLIGCPAIDVPNPELPRHELAGQAGHGARLRILLPGFLVQHLGAQCPAIVTDAVNAFGSREEAPAII